MAKRRDKKRKAAQKAPPSRLVTTIAGPSDAWLPRPHADKKRIFYLVSNYTGTGWYRCHVPGSGLKKKGHTVILNHEANLRDLQYFDIVVFQMSAGETAKQFIEHANSFGKTTVFEIDDDYWNMTPDNPVYEEWQKGDGLRLLRECMKSAKVVTTTTPYLQRILGRHHPNVNILPNMLPEEHWQVQRPPKDGKLVIGWAGGTSHYKDVALISGTMEQILDDYPHVELWLIGMAEYPIRPHPKVRFLEAVKIEELAGVLANFDVGLAPLVDSHFTRCKSDLKFLEYSKAGAAVIASPIEPYVHSIVDGKNGLLAASPKEWMRQLRRIIEDDELRARLAAEGKRFADGRGIDANIGLWERAYGI